jgi:hypothetical protein
MGENATAITLLTRLICIYVVLGTNPKFYESTEFWGKFSKNRKTQLANVLQIFSKIGILHIIHSVLKKYLG